MPKSARETKSSLRPFYIIYDVTRKEYLAHRIAHNNPIYEASLTFCTLGALNGKGVYRRVFTRVPEKAARYDTKKEANSAARDSGKYSDSIGLNSYHRVVKIVPRLVFEVAVTKAVLIKPPTQPSVQSHLIEIMKKAPGTHSVSALTKALAKRLPDRTSASILNLVSVTLSMQKHVFNKVPGQRGHYTLA